MQKLDISLSFSSPDATAHWAERFAHILRAGDVILMHGDIGAGKSFFARSVIQSLQSPPEDVPSPTFTLVQTYETERGEIWHADLYRLAGPDDIIELGLLDAFDTAISMIEWPDRLGEFTPKTALTLTFQVGATDLDRNLTITCPNPDWAARLADLIP